MYILRITDNLYNRDIRQYNQYLNNEMNPLTQITESLDNLFQLPLHNTDNLFTKDTVH